MCHAYRSRLSSASESRIAATSVGPGRSCRGFPSIDLSQLNDAWWHKEGQPDARGICVEPVPVVQARAAQFKIDLVARTERVLALVGHGTFFYYLTGKVMANCEVTELVC